MSKPEDRSGQFRSDMQKAIESMQAEMRQGFAEIMRHLVDHRVRLDSMDERLNKMDARFDAVGVQLESVKHDISELRGQDLPGFAASLAANLGDYLDDLNKRHDARFTRIEKWVGIPTD